MLCARKEIPFELKNISRKEWSFFQVASVSLLTSKHDCYMGHVKLLDEALVKLVNLLFVCENKIISLNYAKTMAGKNYPSIFNGVNTYKK